MFERCSMRTPATRSDRPRVVRYRTVSAFLADYDQNLSRGSLFVNDRAPLRVGSRVRLTLSLGRRFVRDVEAEVTRTASYGNAVNEVPGMEVRFLGDSIAPFAAAIRESAQHGRGRP